MACYILANIGMGFFNTIIWAMITDVIDDAEVRSGIREDGTIYSVYSFARKLGQAFSSVWSVPAGDHRLHRSDCV